jgi:hypothetical protein
VKRDLRVFGRGLPSPPPGPHRLRSALVRAGLRTLGRCGRSAGSGGSGSAAFGRLAAACIDIRTRTPTRVVRRRFRGYPRRAPGGFATCDATWPSTPPEADAPHPGARRRVSAASSGGYGRRATARSVTGRRSAAQYTAPRPIPSVGGSSDRARSFIPVRASAPRSAPPLSFREPPGWHRRFVMPHDA